MNIKFTVFSYQTMAWHCIIRNLLVHLTFPHYKSCKFSCRYCINCWDAVCQTQTV